MNDGSGWDELLEEFYRAGIYLPGEALNLRRHYEDAALFHGAAFMMARKRGRWDVEATIETIRLGRLRGGSS